MPSDVFEIIELENGDIALKQQGEDEDYLVRIEFSQLLQTHMNGTQLGIAQAMLKAGIQKFYQNLEERGLLSEEADFDELTTIDKHTILH